MSGKEETKSHHTCGFETADSKVSHTGEAHMAISSWCTRRLCTKNTDSQQKVQISWWKNLKHIMASMLNVVGRQFLL